MYSGGLRKQGIIKQSHENMPLITVVTVVRNGEKTLEQTILSVINQTYENIEYIIIDGASTDSTLDIIKKYNDKIDYWISEADKGIYDAMNKGVDLMTGEWVNFMNAGDYFFSVDTINETIKYFNDSSKEIVCGNTIFFSDFFEVIYTPVDIENIRFRMPFCHQAAFVRQSTIKDLKFDISYVCSGDYDFFYRCYILEKQFRYIPLMITYYDMSKGLSTERNDIVTIEYAKSRGKPLNFIACFIVNTKHMIKKMAKCILPGKIVRKIQRKKFQARYGKQNVFDKTR